MNIGMTLPAGLTQYDVKRTTTERLEEVLNAYSEGWTVHTIQHLGARDWVVVARCEWMSEAARDEALGADPCRSCR